MPESLPRPSSITAPAEPGLSHLPEILRRSLNKQPKTRRGQRTRINILESARFVFARDGYSATRISDITKAADVALGTFYGYFDDKTEVFGAVVEPVYQLLYRAARSPYLDSQSTSDVLRQSLRDYMVVYYEHRDIMRVLMEATTVDDRFATVSFEVRSHFVSRIRRNLERAQEAGLAEPMHPLLEGSALGGMVESFCWTWFAMGGEREGGSPVLDEVAFDDMVDVLTRLWTRAVFGPQEG
ncbi:MAG: hypothetical protein QOK19_1808 [Solirubrobacteraceae bacterium]|nr:hypothetical protein [Solirubrobacteraceae bacterium]